MGLYHLLFYDNIEQDEVYVFYASCCAIYAARSSFCSITLPSTKERRSINIPASIVARAFSTFLRMPRRSTLMKESGLWRNGNWQTVAPTMWIS
jgi:hypothetical protein